jgi:hypothetical protein
MGTYEWIVSKELGNRVIEFVARVRAETTEDAKRMVISALPELKTEQLHVSIVSSSWAK